MRYLHLSCRGESGISTLGESEWSTSIEEFPYGELEAATKGFCQDKLLGRGSHGWVYKGVLSNGRLVAVKKPCRAHPPHQVDNEIHILSKIRSPSIVNLVGFSEKQRSSQQRLLVVEFMSNGTLYDLLHSRKKKQQQAPSWGRRIRLALQTANAIHTLHSLDPPVIHRDIKSANVLIDRNFNARLGDFGLALQCHAHKCIRTPPAGTIGYLDPGYITPHNLSTKTDVFSFGILLLEMISSRKAIDIAHSPPSILDWALPLIRSCNFLPLYDPRIPPPNNPLPTNQLALLAAKCVRSRRDRRPSIKHVLDCLAHLSNIIPHHRSSSSSSFNHHLLTNPCIMLHQVVATTTTATAHPHMSNSSKKSNNLMDLMAHDHHPHAHDDAHSDAVICLTRNPSIPPNFVAAAATSCIQPIHSV